MLKGFPPVRQAGGCLHITALPGDLGIGELGGAASAFIDALAGMELRVWQILPTGPTGFGNSPYQALSSFAGNELLIDISNLVQQGLLREEEVDELRHLPPGYVDFNRLVPIKTRLLDLAAERFQHRAECPTAAGYQKFLDAHDAAWLTDYALYRALKRHHNNRSWIEWPEEYRERRSEAVSTFGRTYADELTRIKIQQFFFFSQWQRLKEYAREKGVLLFGDTPIYVALDSADVWAEPQLVRLDPDNNPIEVGGVPPDSFSDDGQLWGNPLYDWDHHLQTDFAWWRKRLIFTYSMVDLVRIDHFRGLEAYWAIPFGEATARSGCWRLCPGYELLTAVFNDLNEPAMIAEDLGYMNDKVHALRDHFNIPGLVFLQEMFRDNTFDPDCVSPHSVCYPSTHDSDTIIGWFHGQGKAETSEAQKRLQQAVLKVTGGTGDRIAEDFVRLALAGNSNLTIVQLQDFLELGSEARFNTPGTVGCNWHWRVTRDQLDRKTIDYVKGMVQDSQRQRQAW